MATSLAPARLARPVAFTDRSLNFHRLLGLLVAGLVLILGLLFRLEQISVPLSLYTRAIQFLVLAETRYACDVIGGVILAVCCGYIAGGLL